jgi:GDP-4-dehydro-6-deoxy-D-mannose reductase
MRVLVTGADGFVGRHLCQYLRSSGDEVFEASGPAPKPALSLSKGSGAANRLDLRDRLEVEALVDRAKPEGIINLAGFSSVASAEEDPLQPWTVNTLGPLNILTVARKIAPSARILLVGSGEMYGLLPQGVRATEQMPLNPLGFYGASKAAAEIAGLQFHRRHGTQVILARPFSHIGPGQRANFSVPTFAAQIQTIGAGRAEALIRVGNLNPVRDFLHVQDTVAAYRVLLTHGQPGEAYNICSGVGRTIRSLLEEMLRVAGVDARVQVDPARVRPADIPWLVGNPEKLAHLGWEPKRTVSLALKEVLEEFKSAG